jgi:hypothetical protein
VKWKMLSEAADAIGNIPKGLSGTFQAFYLLPFDFSAPPREMASASRSR